MKLMYSFSGVLILIIGLFDTAFAQPSRFSREQFTNGKGDTLNYRMLYPDANPSRKYPLIIFLHGSGERGKDNDAQLKWGASNFASDAMMSAHPALVIAPQCPAGMSWSNIDEDRTIRQIKIKPTASKPMELTIALIQKLIKTMPVDMDTTMIYVTGLSMGGYGTYDAMMRYPNLFAAAVPVSGAGDVAKAGMIAHIPTWIFHGADDAAVPAMYSYDMLDALTKAGGHPGFTLYPNVGHFSWLEAYTDQLMIEWLFKQHK